jgi:hypothetical protein
MKFLIGIIWLSAFALMFACVASIADDPNNHGLPLVEKIPASEPASVVPWRLLTLCPVNSSNIPHYKDRIA